MNFIKKINKYWFWFIVFGFCLVPLIWFLGKGNILINGLDTNFPLDPLVWLERRFYVWNSSVNAGVDFSSSISGFFFHLIQAAPYLVGFSLKNVEIISILFWFSAIIFSSLILSKHIFPKSRLAQLTCVILYSLNIYLFNTWENIKVSNLALYAVLPIFIYILDSLINGAINYRKAFLYFVLVSILASGAGINPAYFSVIVMTISTFTFLMMILRKGQLKKIFYSGTLALGSLILTNLYWILPLSSFLLGKNISGLSDLGFTNWLDSLSKNTSLVNVIRLQGAWDWYSLDQYGTPLYLPYTLNYLYKLPFIVFSFIPPALALLSLIFIRREKKGWYVLFGILMLLGIFLGAGSHPPTGSFYMFLSRYLPFFSFFRSPWYIFTPLLTLSYAVLVGLLIDRIEPLVKAKRLVIFRFFVFGFLISYLLYNYPLITGKIFRPGRNDSFYINFPSYVYETKDWLNKENDNENTRIITYPDDQLESFKWGYQATESILGLFSKKEIITPSFNLQSSSFGALLDQFYNHLKRGEYKSAVGMFNVFGADMFFVKDDASSLAPLVADTIGDLGQITSIGKWRFLEVENTYGKIFSPTKIYVDLSNSNSFVGVASILGEGIISLNGSSDNVVGRLDNYDSFSSIQEAGQVDSVDNIGSSIKTYFVEIINEGRYTLALEKKYLTAGSLKFILDGKDIPIENNMDNDGLIILKSKFLTKGKHFIKVIYPENSNVLDIKDYRQLTQTPNLKLNELPENLFKTLVAFNNENKERDIVISVPQFNPFIKYLVEMDYKYLYGSVPIVDIIQSAPTSPVKTFTYHLGSSFDWEHKQFVIDPVSTESKLEIFLKLPANKPGDSSKTFIENISLKRVYDNRLFFIEEASLQEKPSMPEVTVISKSPVKYTLRVTNAGSPYILAFLDNFSKNWTIRRVEGGFAETIPHFTVNGYANGWYVPEGENEQVLVLYYAPQTLYVIGLTIFLTVLIISIVINLTALKKFR